MSNGGMDVGLIGAPRMARRVPSMKNGELALQAGDAAISRITDNVSEMIARFDCNGRYDYINSTFKRINAIRSVDVIGKSPAELLSIMPHLRSISATIEEVIATGIGSNVELTCEILGKPVCWHVSAVPEHAPDGTLWGVLSVWKDSTDQLHDTPALQEASALGEIASRCELTREEERKRISQELHDEMGQQLTALRLGISAMRHEFQGNSIISEHIHYLLGIVDQTMRAMRNVVASLRPAALDAGIVAALEWLAEGFYRDLNLVCKLQIPNEDIVLDEARSTAVFRIVQEALTNAARHAGATQVTISLKQVMSRWVLEVRDDGRGFDDSQNRKTFGLVGMHERALMLGGEIAVVSAPGKGTSIILSIPCEQ